MRVPLTNRVKPETHELTDRMVLEVSAKAYAALLARLNEPAQPNERLKRAMRTPAPWDSP